MVTARMYTGASEMSSDARKLPRLTSTHNTAVTTPRVAQARHLTPRLATGEKQQQQQQQKPEQPFAAIRLSESDPLVRNAISPNITPRSSARKSRIGDSTTSTPDQTPTSTPVSSRPPSVLAPAAKLTPTVSAPLSLPQRERRVTVQSDLGRGRASRDPTAQFFLASDAHPRRDKSPATRPKTGTFVYADGRLEQLGLGGGDGRRSSRSPGPRPVGGNMIGTIGKRRISSRSTPAVSRTSVEPRHVRTAISPPGVPALTPELRILSRTIRGATPRSKSPLKQFAIGSGHATDPKDVTREDTGSRPSTFLTQSRRGPRQSGDSIDEDDAELKFAPTDPTSIPAQLQLSPTTAPLFSAPGSPSERRSGTTHDEATASIADARRERKLLDLEISNSSLLAFNRSLERDNRKLKAELRRYRRVTNASILSQATEISAESFEEEESELSSSGLSEPESPTESEQAEQDAKDRRRIRRDFEKHKQLLDDSRRMNLSIKHCLDVTDLLIAEARHAIQQEAVLTDDDLKGRVLQFDDLDADASSGQALLSPVKEAQLVWNSPDKNSSPERIAVNESRREDGLDENNPVMTQAPSYGMQIH